MTSEIVLDNKQSGNVEVVEIFENTDFGSVRIIDEDGKHLFCGADIANALGYANSRKALIDHCRGVTKRDTPTNGGIQSLSYITEGDVYRLIAHSKLPNAEQFESWVFDDVLPSIRKHGMYATDELLDNPEFAIEVFTALKEEREKRRLAEKQIEEQQPKVELADAIIAGENCCTIDDVAKLLRSRGINIGRNRLFEILRKDGYLLSASGTWNKPSQDALNNGWFELEERNCKKDGVSVNYFVTLVTPKGQQYLLKKYGQAAQAAS